MIHGPWTILVMIKVLPRFRTKFGNWAAKVETKMKNKKRFLNILYFLEIPCNDYERIKPYFKASKRRKVSKL